MPARSSLPSALLVLLTGAIVAACDPTGSVDTEEADLFDGHDSLEQGLSFACTSTVCSGVGTTYIGAYRVGVTATSTGELLQVFRVPLNGTTESLSLLLRKLRSFSGGTVELQTELYEVANAGAPNVDGTSPIAVGDPIDLNAAGTVGVVSIPLTPAALTTDKIYALRVWVTGLPTTGAVLVGVGVMESSATPFTGPEFGTFRRGLRRMNATQPFLTAVRFRPAGEYDLALGLTLTPPPPPPPPTCVEGARQYLSGTCGRNGESHQVERCVAGAWQPDGCGSVVLRFQSTVSHVYNWGTLPAGVALDNTVVFTVSLPAADAVPDSEIMGFASCNSGYENRVGCDEKAWTFPSVDYTLAYSGGHVETGQIDRAEFVNLGLEVIEIVPGETFTHPGYDTITFMSGYTRILVVDDFSGNWLTGPVPAALDDASALTTAPSTFWRTMYFGHWGGSGWGTYNYDYMKSPNRTVVTRTMAACEPGMTRPGPTPCGGSQVYRQDCRVGSWVDSTTCVSP